LLPEPLKAFVSCIIFCLIKRLSDFPQKKGEQVELAAFLLHHLLFSLSLTRKAHLHTSMNAASFTKKELGTSKAHGT
jgi:hypothetical protein